MARTYIAPQGIPPTLTSNGTYTLVDAARILGLKPPTLRARLKKLPDFTPKVAGQRLWLFTAADILKMWEMYSKR